jgi:hypothetical protein
MPVIVNVGISRKMSQDYQSQGFSLNITSELPATAVEDPNQMAQATGHLFQLAGDLLDEQVRKAQGQPTPQAQPAGNGNGHGGASQPQAPRRFSQQTGQAKPNGYAKGNGNGGNGGNGRRGITDAQTNAIRKMSQKIGQDGEQVAQDEFGLPLSSLTIRQASDLIDTLKKNIAASTTQGATR